MKNILVIKCVIFLLINNNICFSTFSNQNLSPESQINLTISPEEKELVGKRITNEEIKNHVRSIIIKSLMTNQWRIDLAAKDLNIERKKIRKIVGSKFIKEKKEEFEKNYIFNALESSEWNVSLASKNFNRSPSKIYGIFSKEFINTKRKQIIENQALENQKQKENELKEKIRQREIELQEKQHEEKEKIISVIKKFVAQPNCLRLVAKELKLPLGTLKDRMKNYEITLNEIKFDKNRVIPVLVETSGSLRAASKILGIERSILAKRFATPIKKLTDNVEKIQKTKKIAQVLIALKETDGVMIQAAKTIGINPSTLASWVKKYKIQKLSSDEKISYRISNYFFMIDDMLINTFNRTNEIDKRKKDSIHFFLNTTKFKLFHVRSNLKRLNEEAEKNNLSEDIIMRFKYYSDFVNAFYNELDIEEANRNELLLVLKNATKTMNDFVPQIDYQISKLELYKEENIEPKKSQNKTEDKFTPKAETKKAPQNETIKKIKSQDKSQKKDDIQTEETKIIKAIKLFVSQNNCLSDAATYLNLSVRSLKNRMKKYDIYLDEIKYSEERVIPVLIETLADVNLTAKILNLDKYDLKRRFSKQILNIKTIIKNIQKTEKIASIFNAMEKSNGEINQVAENMGISLSTLKSLIDELEIFSLSPVEKITLKLNSYFINIDDTIIKLHKRSASVDNHKEASIKKFINTTKFMLFQILTNIQNLKKEFNGKKIPEDVLERMEYYEQYINSLYNIIHTTDKDLYNLLLIYAEISIKMNDLKPHIFHLYNNLMIDNIDHTPRNISKNYQSPLQKSA